MVLIERRTAVPAFLIGALFSGLQAQWSWRNPLPAGNPLMALTYASGNKAFAVGEKGALIESSDGGTNWRLVRTEATGNLYNVHFPNPDTGYAVGEQFTVLRSVDGGGTWKKLPKGRYGAFIEGIHFSSGKVGYLTANDGVYFTQDAGESWTMKLFADERLYAVRTLPDGGALVAGRKMYRVSYGAAAADTMSPSMDFYTNGFQFLGRDTAYATGRFMYRTSDQGRTWESVAISGIQSMASSYFTGYTTGFIGTAFGQILRTRNGGASWDTVFKDPRAIQINRFCFWNPGTGMAVGSGGTVLRTVDSGSTWNQMTLGVANWLYSIDFPTPGVGVAVGREGIMLRSRDGGSTWDSLPRITDTWFTKVRFPAPRIGYAVAMDGSIAKSRDAGESWSLSSSNSGLAGLNGLHFFGEDTGFVCGSKREPDGTFPGAIGRTTDGGKTWSLFVSTAQDRYNSIHFPNRKTGYAVGDGGALAKTTDGGLSWSEMPRIDTSSLNNFGAVEFTSEDTGFAIAPFQGAWVHKTVDGGYTWKAISAGGPISTYLQSLAFLDNRIGYAVGTWGQVRKTADGGETWTVIDNATYNELRDIHLVGEDNFFVAGYPWTILSYGPGYPASIDRRAGRPTPRTPAGPRRLSLSNGVLILMEATDALGRPSP